MLLAVVTLAKRSPASNMSHNQLEDVLKLLEPPDSLMHVNVNCRVPVVRESESDFVVPILVDIIAPGKFNEDSGNEHLASEFTVGRMWAERLDWFLAETLGYHPARLCDAASAIWMQVYETLMNRQGNGFRKDLNIDDFVNEIVFIHELLIHPEITDRLPLLDAAIQGISGENSLVMMHYEQALPHNMEDWEYRDLGFKKIARSNLLIRDNHCRYPFGDAHYAGRVVEFTATAEHEEWLLEQWNQLTAEH